MKQNRQNGPGYKYLSIRFPAALWKRAMVAKIEGRIKSVTQACIEGLENLLDKVKEAGD